MAAAPSTWRAFLGEIIREPEERKRLAGELDVSEITLSRWVSRDAGSRRPHANNLYRLIEHIAPQHREALITLLQQDFPDLRGISQESVLQIKEVPAQFFSRVLDAYNLIEDPYQRYWAICHMVLQQAIAQLDPDREGLTASVMCCLPPRAAMFSICSVYQAIYLKTGKEMERAEPLLLGAETLPGYAIATRQPAISLSFSQESRLPVWPLTDEESAAAYPLMRHGRVAGALSVTSRIPSFFTSARRELLVQYTQLLSLAFDAPDFFSRQTIHLAIFARPHSAWQRPYLERFRERVAAQITQDAIQQRPARSMREVEIAVLQETEKALLRASASFHQEGSHTDG